MQSPPEGAPRQPESLFTANWQLGSIPTNRHSANRKALFRFKVDLFCPSWTLSFSSQNYQ